MLSNAIEFFFNQFNLTLKERPMTPKQKLHFEIKSNYLKLMEAHTASKRSTMSHKWNRPNWVAYEQFRIAHIAYSMFRGSTFEEVESKWKDPKNPLNSYVKSQAMLLLESYNQRLKQIEAEAYAEVLTV